MNGNPCFHCGLPVDGTGRDYEVEVDGVSRRMCCAGCQAVAQSIVDNGLSDYYRNRNSYADNAGTPGSALIPDELKLYDAPEVIDSVAEKNADGSSEGVFSLEGIRCAACVWLIERRLARLPGVLAAEVNVAAQTLHVRWDEHRCSPGAILQALRAIGYTAYPFDAARQGEQLRRTAKQLFRQLFVAGLSMMQVMMYAIPVYFAEAGTIDADIEALMRWASLLLTIPAVCYSALPFFQGAWSNLKNRMLGMDVPVALGIAAAFCASVVATFRGSGDVYFDSVTMFVFLLLGSRYLELLARRKAASALERLRHGLPPSACRMPAYPASRSVETVPAARLAQGDFLLVKPGESLAADCVLVEGACAIDGSLLSGESRLLTKTAGDSLPGGAINVSQPIVVQVTSAVADSTLSTLVKLVERAGQGKPRLAQWADRVAARFIAALLIFAASVLVAWHFVDPARAWQIAIAVLVVSCPCALSLATPSALAAATARLLRRGVLIVRPHVLETLERCTHVVFDKTGTLTLGRPSLHAIESLGCASHGASLRLAAALETSSAHPLARAILDSAQEQWITAAPVEAADVRHEAGSGMEGIVEGRRYRLGSESFVRELAGSALDRAPDSACTPVYLGTDGAWLARFDIADRLRPEARDVVAHFKARGKQVVLLSGDHRAVAAEVARQLGISSAFGEQLPEQKLDYVRSLQQEGAVVAMVGDGINDAAVLRAADVSFALGAGAALTQASADAVLLADSLDALRDTARAASQTMQVVRQNLAWATIYNVVAIPAAALGWLNPWLAGLGMSASSAVVVLNALRLCRMPRTKVNRVGGKRLLAIAGLVGAR